MAITVQACTCPLSSDSLFCAKCGGTLSAASGILSKIELNVQKWFYELDSEQRLNPTLMMYMAIDRQLRQGTPTATAVQLAVKDVGMELTSMRDELGRRLAEKFDELRSDHESAMRFMRETLQQHIDSIVKEIKTMAEQGKSIGEVEARVTEAAGALQTYLTAMRLPGVKGEEGEVNVLRDLHDAFLGQPCIRIEPIGGADATDVLVKFYHGQIEIGRNLVEVKSRKTWSNEYIDQTRNDMKRYNAPFALLAVDKLPKTAKARGFHVDTDIGVLIITSAELVVPTVTMFYEIHAASYRMQRRTLDLESIAADRDLVHYINDNMKILENCKKITDVMEDAKESVDEQVTHISARLKENAGRIAVILAKFSAYPKAEIKGERNS